MRFRSRSAVLAVLVCVPLALSSCGKQDRTTIGLSFGEFATERWAREQALLTSVAKDRGIQVISRIANFDAALQARQIEELAALKVDALIIVPIDGALCAPAVEAAKSAGVKIIAYDRLIRSPAVDVFITFDNVEVGRAQAAGVLKARPSGDFVLLGGSPSDFNARSLRQGQMEVLQPLIDAGKVRIAADEWVDNWLPALALSTMERVLKALGGKIDAVVGSNDGTALAAIGALKRWDLAGKVPVSGQDAVEGACKAVVDGTLSLTVFKDFRVMAPMAIGYAASLVDGKPLDGLKSVKLSELTLDESVKGSVACRFLPVVAIDRSNVYDQIVRPGFQSYDAVYADVPADKRPPRP